MERKFGSLSSSVNPGELATTVNGIIRVVAGALVTFGLLNVTDGNTLMEQSALFVSAGMAAFGAAETVFGLIRKVVVKFAVK